MSRHRNVRSMNYTDEYDGYDDVYGHSVEDDYCVSPSQAAFMYDREGPKAKPKIGAFLERDNDIAEENEDIESKESNLSDIDRARLEACIEQIKQNVNVTLSKQDLVDIILLCNFNAEKSLKFLTDIPEHKDNKQEKDVKIRPKIAFTIPKLTAVPFRAPVVETETNYVSLSDLTGRHLSKVGFERNLNAVVHTVSAIKLESDIDLTKALRFTKSVPQVRAQTVLQEKFVPQFVDCEYDASPHQAYRDCSMDISWILRVRQGNRKAPSKFGKVICARYKTPALLTIDADVCVSDIRRFRFDKPSPDDLIRHHLFCR